MSGARQGSREHFIVLFILQLERILLHYLFTTEYDEHNILFALYTSLAGESYEDL